MLVSALLVATSAPVWAQPGRSAAPQPTPAPIFARARTAFLVNATKGQSADEQFRELRAEMRKWNHFKLVNASKGADVIISLATTPGRTLTVRQAATGTILWSTDGTVGVMVKRMKQQLPPGPSVCVAFWCW